MSASLTKLLCAFFVSAFFFFACKTYDNDSNVVRQMQNNTNQTERIENIGENQNQAKDDAEELGKYVRLPFVPEEALWKNEPVVKNQNDRVPGPTDMKIIAVLKFKSEDAQKIVEQAEKYKPAVENSISVENWFPPELVAKSQESGDESVKGTAYAPNDFTQSPYLNGTLTRISETNYFVLELFTN